MTDDYFLYAEWEKQTDTSAFIFSSVDAGYAVAGLSESGKAADITKLVIPDTYDSIPVVAIADSAFSASSEIEEIVLHDGIIAVGADAFKDCVSLQKIVLVESLVSFNLTAVDGCMNLQTIRFNNIKESPTKGYENTLSERFAALDVSGRSPRYILVSGSSGAYGINAELFNSKMDMEILVFGVQVGMGMHALLSAVVNFTTKGDVVIFSPEFLSWIYGLEYGILERVSRLVSCNTYVIEKMSYLDNLPLFESILSTPENFRQNTPPSSNRYDDYGTLANYRANNSEGYFSTDQQVNVDINLLTDSAFAFLHKIKLQLAEKGATLVFSFAPHNRDSMTLISQDTSKRQEFTDALKELLDDIPLISDMDDYFFEGKYFWDSNYHLSTEGATLRTNQLIKDLKAQIEKEAAV